MVRLSASVDATFFRSKIEVFKGIIITVYEIKVHNYDTRFYTRYN